jgi:hypothetical protein
MATHWSGTAGLVAIGATLSTASLVAEITKFSVEEEIGLVDDTAMGDTSRTHISGAGIRTWTATIECHWDDTDTTGQTALSIGASVTVNLCPEGRAAGDRYASGTASVVNKGVDVPMEGTITSVIQVQGNGALTWGVAA